MPIARHGALIRGEQFSAIVLFLSLLIHLPAARADHPELFVILADHDAIHRKVQEVDWARTAYNSIKDELDRYVQYCQKDPSWLTSRLLMNWQTHYQTPIVKNERWIGGEGHAPVPTPRFAGARDWATHYHSPTRLEDFKPYNDDNGKVFLVDDSGAGVWVDPGLTGRTIETANARILQLAANASFVYWITGDEKYAHFASDIFWTYVQGLSCVTLPKDISGKGENKIIGMTSFEVIHEDSMLPLGEAYDFLHDYLQRDGKDLGLIQAQLKKLADRVVDGGSAQGNWNLNQAKEIAPCGLVLDPNADFADGKGREYYVNILLNARLPAQTGIVHVMETGYDSASGLWPEAPGYGFGTTPQIIQIASYLRDDPQGAGVLRNPLLVRAIFAQTDLLYPNGWSIGLGDTDNTRIEAPALELMIAVARKQGDHALEAHLTAALTKEIDGGFYDRSKQANIPAITQYVDHLLPVSAEDQQSPRSFFGKPLNVLMLRNGTDPDHALAEAMYGTDGGHVHANGLAIELYGAGLILGADPGRGISYWTADQHDYYAQPPAHNTVVVNASSDYPMYGPDHVPMKLDYVEPQSEQPAMSPDINFAQASFTYAHPAASQQRTLALIRTGPRSGFYFDVFRSRADSPGPSFHDYLYHNIGQSLALSDEHGQELPLSASQFLKATKGGLKGYDYFASEESAEFSGTIHGIFTTEMPDQSKRVMSLWMLGHNRRRVFSVMAPPDHAGRTSLPKSIVPLPMPTLLVRQNGDAWRNPFVAVYEPYIDSESAMVQDVRPAKVEGDAASVVACNVILKDPPDTVITLIQDDDPSAVRNADGIRFQGSFGVVIRQGNSVEELYLGHGKTIGDKGICFSSADGSDIDASLFPKSPGWEFSSSGRTAIGGSSGTTTTLPAGRGYRLNISQ